MERDQVQNGQRNRYKALYRALSVDLIQHRRTSIRSPSLLFTFLASNLPYKKTNAFSLFRRTTDSEHDTGSPAIGPADSPKFLTVALLIPQFDHIHDNLNALLTKASAITMETTSESIRLEDPDLVQVLTRTST
jgi:hypothetical protein